MKNNSAIKPGTRVGIGSGPYLESNDGSTGTQIGTFDRVNIGTLAHRLQILFAVSKTFYWDGFSMCGYIYVSSMGMKSVLSQRFFLLGHRNHV